MASFGELLGAEILEAREAQRLTQLALAQEVFDDENYVRRIGDYETGKVARPQAKVYRPICDFLGITSQTIGALRAQATDAKTVTDDELLALRSEKGSLEQALSDLQTLSRAQLETLASRFELDKPYEASDGALIEFLTLKATDFRALRAEVDAIDDVVKALSNLKASAMAAFDSGDLDEVEILLSRVQEIAKDEAAKAAEIRADAALLRQRVDFARALLVDAADSFAILDPLEPARRRNEYGKKFFFHGLRYGGHGLRIAADLWESCAQIAERLGDEILRGKALSNQGAALRNQGTRTEDPVGAGLLAQAVTAFRAALGVHTRKDHPLDWATTQNNLAIALRNQGSRTHGPEGAALLAQAVNAYRAALEVYTTNTHPVDWAATQNNLAGALHTQGSRTDGPEGAALLAQAVTAYHAALEVRAREAHPVDWAMTQENLAEAEEAIAEHATCTDPAPHLRAALDHVTAALEVYDPEHMPYDFGTATNLKTRLDEKLTALNTP